MKKGDLFLVYNGDFDRVGVATTLDVLVEMIHNEALKSIGHNQYDVVIYGTSGGVDTYVDETKIDKLQSLTEVVVKEHESPLGQSEGIHFYLSNIQPNEIHEL
jgi:hypothetical protein